MIDNIDNDHNSFKDFVEEFKIWYSIIKNNFKVFLFTGILFGSLGVIYAFTRKPFYESKLNFIVINSNSSNIVSSLANLSSLLNSGGGSPLISLTRLIKLIDSDVIIFKSLFKEVVINDRKDFLINHFINLEELDKEWEGDKILSKVVFDKKIDKINDMSFSQRKAFREIQETLIPKDGDGILTKSYDKKSGVVEILTTYTNEVFAIEFSASVFDQIEEFYLIQSNFQTTNSVNVLEKKVDSVKLELTKKQKLNALYQDRNKGILLQEDKVALKNLALEEQMLTLLYAETKKNYETFKFMEESFTPPFLVVNQPYMPLEKLGYSKKKWLVLCSFVSCFFLFLFYRLDPIFKKIKDQYLNK